MKPEIYKEKEKERKVPRLSLTEDRFLDVVDKDGFFGARLLAFKEDRIIASEGAESKLEIEGFDTSFANWDSEGRLKLD